MRIQLLLSAAAAALLCGSPALAQDATEVEEVIVTATRLPSSPVDAPGLRVVTAAEIEALQADFIGDVLVTIPGVSLYREGAFGGLSSLRLRGASTDKTLVLVDGVPVNDPSSPSGAFDFSDLSLTEVERIEVLSGPQSSLWGSAAIGGLVSITTRETDGLSAVVEGGSYGTLRGSLAVGRSEENHAVSAFVSAFRTDGISKADEADGNREDDGFESFAAGVAGRIRVTPSVELDGRIRYSESDVDIDGFPAPLYLLADTNDRSHSRTWSGFGRARIAGPADINHTLSVSLYDIDRSTVGSSPSHFTAERQVWRWTAEHDRSEDCWGLVGGVEHQRERGDASVGDAELETTSVFAVGRFDVTERVVGTLGLRHDAPDDFDGETTFRATLAADLGGGFRLNASYGTGFKTPTVSQVLCDYCWAPPVAISPETAQGWDVTLGWRSEDRRFEASITAFGLDVEDQITYVGGRYENISRTSAKGLEADLRAELGGGFALKAGYAYSDAIDETTGARLLRAPEHSGSATLFYARERFDAALTLRAESEQLDVVGWGTGVRDGFAVVDLAAGFDLTSNIRLTARIENLTDKHYQEAYGYGEPGRSAYVGLRLRY